MVILDRIDECNDGKDQPRGWPIRGITIHQFSVPDISNMVEVAQWLKENPEYTGGQMSYTYGVLPDGTREQALKIAEIGWHALAWSSPTIGIVFLGDFSKEPPTPIQWEAGLELAAEITLAIGIRDIRGHSERPEASKSRVKQCPGRAFDMNAFRAGVRRIEREMAIQRLANALHA